MESAILSGLTIVFLYHFSFTFHLAPESDLPLGLPNPKNICYLNSVIQAIASSPSLVRLFERAAAHSRDSKILSNLVCILAGLQCSSRYIFANQLDVIIYAAHSNLLDELIESGCCHSGEQQDAHELFNFFMQLASNPNVGSSAAKASKGLNLIPRFIGQQYEKRVPVRKAHRLTDCLAKQFGCPQNLPDLECTKCKAKNGIRNDGYQESWLAHLPACLTLYIQRSNWSNPFLHHQSLACGGIGTKCLDHITFPYRLSMADYMLSARNRRRLSFNGSPRAGSSSIDELRYSSLKRGHLLDSFPRQPRTYSICSVIVHHGLTPDSGHYTVYRLWHKQTPEQSSARWWYSPRTMGRLLLVMVAKFFKGIPLFTGRETQQSPWIVLSDGRVERIAIDVVRSSPAYMLLYERDTRPHGGGSRRRHITSSSSLSIGAWPSETNLADNTSPTGSIRLPARTLPNGDNSNRPSSSMSISGRACDHMGEDSTDNDDEDFTMEDGDGWDSDFYLTDDLSEQGWPSSSTGATSRADIIRTLALAASS